MGTHREYLLHTSRLTVLRAWLLSLASDLPQTRQNSIFFAGFDISPKHFPAPENLPANTRLDVLDAFADELPEHLIGVFDVVHVRMFFAVVKNNDPGPLIRNAVRMLKPGGYLQWDDMDGGSKKAIPPNPSVVATATADLIDAIIQSQLGMNIDYTWIRRLGEHFQKHGLQVVDDIRMELKKELRKMMTDSSLMVQDHIAKIHVKNGVMAGTGQNWGKLWAAANAEVDRGVTMVMDLYLCVGQKPLEV